MKFIACIFLIMAAGCGNNGSTNSTEDSSASGTVAAALGGGVNGSSGGTLSFIEPKTDRSFKLAQLFDLNTWLPDAFASAICPTIAGSASGCVVSGTTATLTYTNCSFSGSSAVWSGSQAVQFTGATPSCGSTFPTSQTSVLRTFPQLSTRISPGGTTVQVDTQGALTFSGGGNTYTNASVSGGYTVGWTSGLPSSITINGVNLKSSGSATWWHSLQSSILTITNGNTISSGSVTLYHNYAKVMATSVLSNLVFQSGSCTPVSGSIATTYSTGAASGFAKYNGATETLKFTGAGTATYTGVEGYSGNVTLGHCF